MARRFAQILTEIWSTDFTERSANAQRVYFLLISQPDLAATGVLGLSERRWSKLASDTKRDGIEDGLRELAEHAYVMVDEDAEELLIRTYMRHDGGWRNPNHRKTIAANYQLIHSQKLRAVVAQAYLDLTGQSINSDRQDAAPSEERTSSQGMNDAIPDAVDDAMGDGLSDGMPHLPAASSQQPTTNTISSSQHNSNRPPVKLVAAAAGNHSQIAEGLDLAVSVRERQSSKSIRDPKRWRATVRRDLETEHGSAIAASLAAGCDLYAAVAGALGVERTLVAAARLPERGYL